MNAWKWRSLLLFWILIAVVSIECAKSPAVYMQVSKDILREGDSYNVTCSFANLLEEHCPNRSEINIATKHIKRLKTYQLNDTAIYYEVKSAQAQHYTDGYYCLCGEKGLRSCTFQIGVHLNITNFVCRFLDVYGAELKCDFNAPRAFEMNSNTTFRMKYGVKSYNCSANQTTSDVQCIVPSADFDKFAAKYELTVIMADGLGEMNMTFTPTRTECIVLPPIGEELQVLSRNSSAICLAWSEKQRSNHREYGVAYDVEVQPSIRTQLLWQQQTSNKLSDSYCLSPLSPHQNYKLRVRRRLNVSNAIWSEWFEYKFSTADAIPARAPFVWSNGYSVNSDSHILFVYWEELQTSEYLGYKFTYNVSVLLTGQDKNQVVPSNTQVKSNYAIISNLPAWTSSDTYAIIMRSQNNVGLSQNSSRIMISQLANAKDRQPTSLCIDKEAQQLRWTKPKTTTDLIAYTVYWCDSNRSGDKQCRGTKHLEAHNTNSLDNYFNLKVVDAYKFYQWGVAGNYSSTAAGGITWLINDNTCVISLGRSLETIIALSVLGIIFTLYFLIRKCRYMSDIKVDLPPGVLIDQQSQQVLLSSKLEEIVNTAMITPVPIAKSAHTISSTVIVDNVPNNTGIINSLWVDNIDNNETGYTELSPMLKAVSDSNNGGSQSINRFAEPAVMLYVKMDALPIRQLSEYVMPPATYS